jgi:ABC-type multidrug transport system ATPase subunit
MVASTTSRPSAAPISEQPLDHLQPPGQSAALYQHPQLLPSKRKSWRYDYSMNFFVLPYPIPKVALPAGSCILAIDDWNDYGFICQFHLYFRVLDGSDKWLGRVKILKSEGPSGPGTVEVAKNTTLGPTFPALAVGQFISLGQGTEYYENLLASLGSTHAIEALEALCDISWKPSLAPPFEPNSAFFNALLRSNDAHRARRFGRAVILGEPLIEQFHFPYQGMIPGAEAPVQAMIDFEPGDTLPGRIVAIIGRNAVGKTQFLSHLARDLAQTRKTTREKELEREDRFFGMRPLFTRVLAVSYSAFDKFTRPKTEAVSYIYCGIRDDSGGLSRRFLVEEYRKNLDRIRKSRREAAWTRYMQQILADSDEVMETRLAEEINDPSSDDESLSLLSSGQAILAHFVTALLAWIQPNSLVLFDEPETHLHPNAVSNLFNVLTEILTEFDSFSIVATHSAIVIQQVPASRVLVFSREGNITQAEPLGLESFGESVTELTRHVFETLDIDTLYRRTLRKLARTERVRDTVLRFPRGLSLNAQAYLIGQRVRITGGDDTNE